MKSFVAFLSLALIGCVGPFSEDLESNYPDVPAARRAGAFERGWLPEIVPSDASDISETHNLDTNITWGCFDIPSGPGDLRRRLEEHGAERIDGPVGPGPGARWWPSSMAAAHVEAYRVREDGGFTLLVGIESTGNKACLHRSRK